MPSLELQPSFPRRISQRRDPTMILEVTPIKTDLLDACRQSSFRNHLANRLGRHFVAAVIDAASQILVASAGRNQSSPSLVVDYLAADMLQAAENRQPRTFRRTTNRLAYSPLPPLTDSAQMLTFVHDRHLNLRCYLG